LWGPVEVGKEEIAQTLSGKQPIAARRRYSKCFEAVLCKVFAVKEFADREVGELEATALVYRLPDQAAAQVGNSCLVDDVARPQSVAFGGDGDGMLQERNGERWVGKRDEIEYHVGDSDLLSGNTFEYTAISLEQSRRKSAERVSALFVS
jgi:hypothetical protein